MIDCLPYPRGWENWSSCENSPLFLRSAELAALDLKEAAVQHGDTKSYTLYATFPEAGLQLVYLNAMIRDISQFRDERQAFAIRVLPPE